MNQNLRNIYLQVNNKEKGKGNMEERSQDILVACKGLYKSFGPTRALINVDFSLKRGEVCGLIGENGSGKSTLTSIFAGVQPGDRGELFYRGEAFRPANMLQAQNHGVAMIVQEAATLPTVKVSENVFVGNLHSFTRLGMVETRKMNAAANRILDEIGVRDIRAEMPTAGLNFEDRKIVEIARAMYLKPDVLIVDETTTALAQKGRAIIYRLIERMKEENRGVIFISHDLDELKAVCNTVTVLRDGVFIQRLDGEEITVDNMRRLMVGREISQDYYRSDYDASCSDEVVLEARHITSANGYIRHMDMKLHRGEILGLGGLANSGMHEIGRLLFGIDPAAYGEVIHTKSNCRISAPAIAIKNRIGYVSKNRDAESIILEAGLQENVVLASLGHLHKFGYITERAEKQVAEQQIRELRIKCAGPKQFCSEFSGGNKQKVAFAKWLAADCDIIIMDCPTRGIDIGVKAAMYKLIYNLKKQGKAIIMISEELPELIGMSDRMLIMKDGEIVKEIMRSPKVTDSQLIRYMI